MLDLKAITPLALDSRLHQDGVFIPFDIRVDLMQYTGLKDKNGVEIYEGDVIVQDSYPFFDDGKPGYRGIVEWIYSQWQVVLHCVDPAKAGISDGINGGINDDGFDEGSNTPWEIIGNLYEHPQLLGKSNDAELERQNAHGAPADLSKDEAIETQEQTEPRSRPGDATNSG